MEAHLLTRCVAAALAEEAPLGPLLRDPAVGHDRAAALAEAGQLDAALTRLGFDAELRGLAEGWPRALPRAVARLEATDDRAAALAPAAASLAVIAVISLAPASVALVFLPRLLATFDEMGAASPASMTPIAGLGLLMVLAALILGVRACAREVSGQVGADLRGVVLAAALVESGAPTERLIALLGPDRAARFAGATAVELRQREAEARAQLELRRQRSLVGVRLLGVGGLALYAASLTLEVYLRLAAVPGAP